MAQFEISLAQAQRDIEYMRVFLRAPLKYVAGCKGYELEDNAFCLPSVWIEDDELLLLAVAYKGMGQYKQRPGILSPLLDAILKKRQAEILYRDVFGPECGAAWRRVTPLHLLFYRANWYLLAIGNGGWRTFSLARLEEVKTLAEKSKPVSRKAIRERIASAFGIFITDQERAVQAVRLRFIPALARFARSVLFHPGQEIADGPGGCLDVSFPSTLNRELIGEILSFGEQVEVLEPEELRARIRDVARKTAEIYGP